jgi:hypothetical protein
MALDLGSITLRNTTLGTITVQQPNRTTIAASDFAPKPNITLAEINDVSTEGVEDGNSLVFSSANNRYEFKIATTVLADLDGGLF